MLLIKLKIYYKKEKRLSCLSLFPERRHYDKTYIINIGMRCDNFYMNTAYKTNLYAI